MKQSHDHHYQKFWFGFAVGSVVCGALATAIGTKQGRSAVRRAVEFMEDVDTKPDQVHQMIDAVYALYRDVSQEQGDSSPTESTSKEAPTEKGPLSPSQSHKKSEKSLKKSEQSSGGSMQTVIDKVQTLAGKKQSS